MIDDRTTLIDPDRTRCLCDVDGNGYLAATAVAADGSSHLLLAHVEDIGDESVTYDSTCATAAHEQLGSLPLEYTRRLAAASRMHRCGRRTLAGHPCRIPVTQPGAACGWHRSIIH